MSVQATSWTSMTSGDVKFLRVQISIVLAKSARMPHARNCVKVHDMRDEDLVDELEDPNTEAF